MLAAMLIGFAILLIIGVPLGFSLVLSTLIYVAAGANIPLPTFPHRMLVASDSFGFMAIPFFFFAGELMNHGGLTKRLVKFANGLVGSVSGGLAYVVVIVNMIMAGMSGSALADAAATGSVLIPAMEKAGYDKKFASALTATAGTIGPVIPPSIPFVLYAGIAGVSVGKLFLAGAVPGVFMGLFMMVVIYVVSKKRKYPREPRQSLKEILIGTKDAALALIMPLIILGSILTGMATPTEGAVVAVIYALIISAFVYKELNLKSIVDVAYTTTVNSAIIMFIVATASQFGWVLSREQVPHKLQLLFTGMASDWITLLLYINVLVLLLGCFMEGNAILVILTPVLLPVLKQYNIDLVHFGVVFVLNAMIGLVTPPVGMNLFVVSRVAAISLSEIVKDLWPFIIALIVLLIVVTYVPAISLWLPSLLMK